MTIGYIYKMEIIRHIINMNRMDAEYLLLPLGDIHWGNVGCDEEMFLRKVDFIEKNKNCFTIGMGDYGEEQTTINERGLKTFEPQHLAQMGKKGLWTQQVREVRQILERIADKMVGMHIGNHDDRTGDGDKFKLDYLDYLKVAAGRDIPYLGERAYVILDFMYKDKLVYQYKLLTGHSRFGGQQPGSVENAALSAYNAYEDFDIMMFGHTHFAFANKHFRRYVDASKPKPETRSRKFYIVNTGTFLRSEVEGTDMYSDKIWRGGIREPATVTIRFTPSKGEFFAYL